MADDMQIITPDPVHGETMEMLDERLGYVGDDSCLPYIDPRIRAAEKQDHEASEYINSFDRPRPATGIDWYDAEIEKDRRLKEALDAEVSAAEAAAKISTTMANAMDIQSAHQDRIEAAYRNIVAHVTLFEEPELEWMQTQMLRDRCYSASRNLRWCLDKLSEQIGYIERLKRNHRGGDVDDEKLLTAIEFTQRREMEIDAWRDELEAASRAYRTLTGNEWLDSPEPDKQQAAKKRRTAAMSQADAILARYNKSA